MSRACGARVLPGLVLVACAVAYQGCATTDPYVAGGTSLAMLGESYVATVPVVDAQCADGGTLSAGQCATWRSVATGFRLGFNPAVDLLNAAEAANDATLWLAASQALTHLRSTLGPYVVHDVAGDGGVP